MLTNCPFTTHRRCGSPVNPFPTPAVTKSRMAETGGAGTASPAPASAGHRGSDAGSSPAKGDLFPSSGPSGPFIVTHLDNDESRGPAGSDRSSSPSDEGDSAASSGDEDGVGSSRGGSPGAGASGSLPGGAPGGAIVIKAAARSGVADVLSVALVAGFLVPCFTVFAPLTMVGPLVCAVKYGVGRYGRCWRACLLVRGGRTRYRAPLYRASVGPDVPAPARSIAPFLALVMGTFALPLYYSAYFKKVIWRPLMLELTNYVRPFKVIKHAALPSDRNYIVCWHPHGRLFYGFAVFCGLFDVFFPELDSREFFGAINEPLFGIPFLRNMLALTGTIGCSRKALDRTLKVCLLARPPARVHMCTSAWVTGFRLKANAARRC